MKIALGTIEVSNDERAAIANFYGIKGLADRDTCRRFITRNGTEEIVNLMFSIQEAEEHEARERHYEAVNNTMLRPDRES